MGDVGPGNHILDLRKRWHHLANAIERLSPIPVLTGLNTE